MGLIGINDMYGDRFISSYTRKGYQFVKYKIDGDYLIDKWGLENGELRCIATMII